MTPFEMTFALVLALSVVAWLVYFLLAVRSSVLEMLYTYTDEQLSNDAADLRLLTRSLCIWVISLYAPERATNIRNHLVINLREKRQYDSE